MIKNHLVSCLQQQWDLKINKSIPINAGYQNHVFEVDIEDMVFILRISSNSTRNETEILSEIMWCNALQDASISVCRPIQSIQQHYVLSFLCMNQTYHAVLFEKVLGHKLKYKEYLGNKSVYQRLGYLCAKLHQNSNAFSHSYDIERPYWYENAYITQFKAVVVTTQIQLHRVFEELVYEINQLETSSSQFGLIHGDINVGNFHVYENEIILFDFDECQWSWYVEDIAIALFYTLYVYGDDVKEDRRQQGKLFLVHFLKEYFKVFPVEPEQLRLIPLFLRLREFIVYVGICKKWDMDHLNEWQEDYLRDTRCRLMSKQPLLDHEDIEWVIEYFKGDLETIL
jgi:amicoumacin kinase